MNIATRVGVLTAAAAAAAAAVALGPGASLASTADSAEQERGTHQTERKAKDQSERTRKDLERGIVLECTGEANGLPVYAGIYENQRYVNSVQVVLGDSDTGSFGYAESDRRFVKAKQADVSVDAEGQIVSITGSVVPQGERRKVHEVIGDAGFTIVSRGWHRSLVTDLSMVFGDTIVPLTCDPAFAYHLHVAKTPVDG